MKKAGQDIKIDSSNSKSNVLATVPYQARLEALLYNLLYARLQCRLGYDNKWKAWHHRQSTTPKRNSIKNFMQVHNKRVCWLELHTIALCRAPSREAVNTRKVNLILILSKSKDTFKKAI